MQPIRRNPAILPRTLTPASTEVAIPSASATVSAGVATIRASSIPTRCPTRASDLIGDSTEWRPDEASNRSRQTISLSAANTHTATEEAGITRQTVSPISEATCAGIAVCDQFMCCQLKRGGLQFADAVQSILLLLLCGLARRNVAHTKQHHPHAVNRSELRKSFNRNPAAIVANDGVLLLGGRTACGTPGQLRGGSAKIFLRHDTRQQNIAPDHIFAAISDQSLGRPVRFHQFAVEREQEVRVRRVFENQSQPGFAGAERFGGFHSFQFHDGAGGDPAENGCRKPGIGTGVSGNDGDQTDWFVR